MFAESYTKGINPGIALFTWTVTSTSRQIDQLVYQLYGLTEEEIKIVEQSMLDASILTSTNIVVVPIRRML